jgi:hypothetical protein
MKRKISNLCEVQLLWHPCWAPSVYHPLPRHTGTLSVSEVLPVVGKLSHPRHHRRFLPGELLQTWKQPEKIIKFDLFKMFLFLSNVSVHFKQKEFRARAKGHWNLYRSTNKSYYLKCARFSDRFGGIADSLLCSLGLFT